MNHKIRNLSILLLLLISSTIGCQKISTPDEASKELFGSWAYVSDSGGFSGNGGSNQFNTENSVEFTEKGVFSIYKGSKRTAKYRFRIELNENSTYSKYKIIFNDSSLRNYIYIVSSDTLLLTEIASDGYQFTFVRK